MTYTTLDASQHSQGAPPSKPGNTWHPTRRASAPSHPSYATVTPFVGAGVKHPPIVHAAQPSHDDLAEKAATAAAELPEKAAHAHADKLTTAQSQSTHRAEGSKHTSAALAVLGPAVEAAQPSPAAPSEQDNANTSLLISHNYKAGTQSPQFQKPADQSSLPTHPPISSGPSAPLPKAASRAEVVAVTFPSSQHSTSLHGAKATLASMSTGPSHQAKHDTPSLEKPASAAPEVQEAVNIDQVDSEQPKQQPNVAAEALPEARAKQSTAGPEQTTAAQQLQNDVPSKGISAQPGRTPAAEVLPIQATAAQKPAQAVSHASRGTAAPGEWLRKRSSSDSRDAQTTNKADTRQAAATDDSAAQETSATSGQADRNVTKPQAHKHHGDRDIDMASAPNADADEAVPASAVSKVAEEQQQQASARAGRLALAPASLQQEIDQSGAHVEVPTADARHELQIGIATGSRPAGSQALYGAAAAGSKPDGSQKGLEGQVEGAPAKTGGWAGKVFKTLFSLAGKGGHRLCCAALCYTMQRNIM